MPPPRADIVCTFHQRGKCIFGDKCTRYHGQVSSSQHPAAPICHFFLQNKCKNGSRCSFLHNTAPSSPHSAKADLNSASGPEQNTPPRAPCSFFRKGFCRNGLACPYEHGQSTPAVNPCIKAVEPENPQLSLNENATVKPRENIKRPIDPPQTVDEEQALVRGLYQCQVSFVDGLTVCDVQTALDSPRISIRNLPLLSTIDSLLEIVEPFGSLKSSNIYPCGETEQGVVEYLDHRDARRAVNALDGSLHRGRTLSAQLDLAKGIALEKAILKSTKVKATWFAPSTIAWAHYATISKAQSQAKALNSREFDHRIVQATFQKPSPRQTESFTVVLKGLPRNFKKDDLRRWSASRSVDIKRPAVSSLGQETAVHALLSQQGILDAFESLPPRPNAAKLVAVAQFARPEDALTAVQILNHRNQPTLNGSPLYLEVIHTIKYQLRQSQLQAILPQLEQISATVEGVTIRWYDHDSEGNTVDPVVLRAHAANPADLAVAKNALEPILRGVVLHYKDESTLWSDQWDKEDKPEVMKEVGKEYGVDLHVDRRTRTVRLFGNTSRKAQCEQHLAAHLAYLDDAHHRIGVPSHQQAKVLQRLADLRRRFGDANIAYDMKAKDIMLKGTAENIRIVRKTIARLLQEVPDTSGSNTEEDCPICMCQADEDDHTLACGHTMCRSCLEMLLKLSNKASCPGKKTGGIECGFPIPLETVREILPPDAEEALLRQAFVSYIDAHPDEYRYCPTPDCEMVFRRGDSGKVLVCPACMERICPSCCVGFHEGLSCAENKDQMSGNYQAFREWKAQNGVKECPTCGVDIQKNGGCNHMTCVKCKTHICWVCMKTFQERGGKNVYDHMNKEHGGLGI